MAIRTILNIVPARFTGAIPCFAISCLTLLDVIISSIFFNNIHFGSFSSITKGVSIISTIKPLYKALYKFFGFVSPGIEFYGFLWCTFSHYGGGYRQYISSSFITSLKISSSPSYFFNISSSPKLLLSFQTFFYFQPSLSSNPSNKHSSELLLLSTYL